MNKKVALTLPDSIYQQAKHLAQAHNRDVTEVLAQSIRLDLVAADVLDEPDIVRESEAFLKLHPFLLEKYPGEYVAIHRGQLVDHDQDQNALFTRINLRYPDQFVLLRPVRSDPEIVYRI